MANDMILRPQNFDQLSVFAQMASKSSMVPVAYRGKPEDIMLAVQMGSEVGLAPMQALQNIAVINGRPCLWGDAMLALCKMHPEWGGIKESVDGDGDKMRAVCAVDRKGDHQVVVTFSADDAKRAGLLGKTGPWQQYPKRMMQMRARGFALRDAFPDALRGLLSAEEAQDIPPDDFKGPTITVTPEPTPEKKNRTVRDIVRDKLVGCATTDDVASVADDPRVVKALKDAPDDIKQELNAMLSDAYARCAENEGSAAEPEIPA